jgi:hypothetical protein
MAYRVPQEDREVNSEFHGAVDRAIEQMRHREQQREVNNTLPVEEVQFLSEVKATGRLHTDRKIPPVAPAEPAPTQAPAPEPTYTPPQASRSG